MNSVFKLVHSVPNNYQLYKPACWCLHSFWSFTWWLSIEINTFSIIASFIVVHNLCQCFKPCLHLHWLNCSCFSGTGIASWSHTLLLEQSQHFAYVVYGPVWNIKKISVWCKTLQSILNLSFDFLWQFWRFHIDHDWCCHFLSFKIVRWNYA